MIRRHLAGLLTSLAFALPLGSLQAHDSHADARTPTLAGIPAGLAGLRIQLADSLAPQLLVENPTRGTLEILGRDGRPFLRLSPDGAEADHHHPDWLASWLPGGLPGRKADSSTPDWQTIRAQPSWGWFDPRLRATPGQTQWRIPVRLGGTRSEIRGGFRDALAGGFWQAGWRSRPQLPQGIRLQLIPGQPYGLMLSNDTDQPVTVLGRQQEPFLRISRTGSHARLDSPLWQETAAQQALRAPATGSSGWQRLSNGSRHVWVDPRTRPPTGASRQQPHAWDIVLRWGKQQLTVQGESRWVKAELPR